VPTTIRAESPLRFLTPKNHGLASWAYSSSFGGGLVDGDHVAMNVAVDEGASALFATQASTKVYRGSSRMTLQARVAHRGLLAIVPDPVVCFEGASYVQRIAVELAPEASLVLVDALTAGRSARGERWAFSRYDSTLRIDRKTTDEVHPLMIDRVRLDEDEAPIAPRFGRFDAIATLVLLGPCFVAHAEKAQAIAARVPLSRRGPALVTASALHDGVLLRVLAMSAAILAEQIRATLSFLPDVLGDDPWARKF